jgi:hypothetical protein
MKTIWKFPLPFQEHITLQFPKGALLLSVQNQREQICLWALVDPAAPLRPREFQIVGTGHQVADAARLLFVGSVQTHEGAFVWHIFEIQPRGQFL